MEIERDVLLTAIKRVMPAVAKTEKFEQASKVAFVGGKVCAFNDAVLIVHPLPGDLDVEGAVDGRHLFDLLGKLTADRVTLDVADGQLRVRAGRTKASFGLLPVTLPIDSVDQTGELVDLSEKFADKLRWASASCAKTFDRPALNCVLVADGHIQASDSYRASRVSHGDAELPRLMLPLDQVQVLVEHELTRVALSEGGEWARFETVGGTMLCTRSMSASWVDPAKIASLYEVEGAEVELVAALSETIDRAKIFAKRDRVVDEEVRIQMRPNQVTVSAQYGDGHGGTFSEVVRCEGSTGNADFSIHPQFLLSALGSGTRCILGERSVKFVGDDWAHVVSLKVKGG